MTEPGGAGARRAAGAMHRPRGAALRWPVVAAGLVLLVLWFGFLDLRALYFPDEGRYAEIPREMLASGDWATPRINGFPYFEKPPLQYWMSAAVFAVAGENEWTARLVPALAGFLGVLAVGGTARRLYSVRAGWMAAAVMAGSCGYFLSAQFITLDMTLTALLTAALCAFLLAQDGRATAADQRRWMLVAWALCALSVLTKGVIGLVLPALAIATYIVVGRDVALLRRLHLVAGMLVMLAIAAPWFVVAEARNPGFAEFFFVREHWQRFTQPVHRRTGPIWYFVPIAIVFLTPWLPALVAATWSRGRSAGARADEGMRAPREFAPAVFAWCWAGSIFAFFSLSSSKLPAYIMPALAGVVLAAAAPMARRWTSTVRLTAWTLVAGGVVVAIAAVPAGRFVKVPVVAEAFAASAGWLVAAGVIFVATGILALALLRRGRRVPALAALLAGGMLGCQVGAVVAHRVDGYFSSRRIVHAVAQGERPFRPELPFYSVDMFDHTMPFYLGRPLVLVHERGELDWGINAAPGDFIPDVAAFAERWRAETDAYAVMEQDTYASQRVAGLPMRVLADDGRRVVVSRRLAKE